MAHTIHSASVLVLRICSTLRVLPIKAAQSRGDRFFES